eukprot:TRINITY_DN27381_c0_g2_i1.p1 TRINITY_DN27381_c0_g2~~TRINITY_DN27381_c0_g2_i1.p1  ORF type:complete len:125 (-),score=13.29 TRINITY_DN27381_c0_g2_i1:560-934(-)
MMLAKDPQRRCTSVRALDVASRLLASNDVADAAAVHNTELPRGRSSEAAVQSVAEARNEVPASLPGTQRRRPAPPARRREDASQEEEQHSVEGSVGQQDLPRQTTAEQGAHREDPAADVRQLLL